MSDEPQKDDKPVAVSPWVNLFALWLTVAGVWKTFETIIVVLKWIILR